MRQNNRTDVGIFGKRACRVQGSFWVLFFLGLGIWVGCKQRDYRHPLDPDGLDYIGFEESSDRDDNGVADVLDPLLSLVPGGCRNLGNDSAADEPLRNVCIDSFYVGQYEVTLGDYRAVINEKKIAGNPDLPLTQVSWFEAIEYCNRISEYRGFKPAYRIYGDLVEFNLEANGFRLLTEAEWEYAYAADSGQKYYWADSLQATAYAWYLENSSQELHPVGLLLPNMYRLYDLSGNVWEWTNDWYTALPGQGENPLGPLSGTQKSMRGGDYRMDLQGVRGSNRNKLDPHSRNAYTGFRLARNLR